MVTRLGRNMKMRHLAIILIPVFRHSGINENEARSSPGSMSYILFSYLGRLLLSVSQINIEFEGVLESETCNCLQKGCTRSVRHFSLPWQKSPFYLHDFGYGGS